MNDEWIATIWIIIVISVSYLIYTYMIWCKEYDSKIVSINRYHYYVKFEDGEQIFLKNDHKNYEE